MWARLGTLGPKQGRAPWVMDLETLRSPSGPPSSAGSGPGRGGFMWPVLARHWLRAFWGVSGGSGGHQGWGQGALGGFFGGAEGRAERRVFGCGRPTTQTAPLGAAAKHGARLQAGAWVADPHFRFVTLTTLVDDGSARGPATARVPDVQKGKAMRHRRWAGRAMVHLPAFRFVFFATRQSRASAKTRPPSVTLGQRP